MTLVAPEPRRAPGGALLLDGKALAATLRERIRQRLEAAGNPPVTLATVLVGDDEPSRIYIRSKHRDAAAVGITGRHTDLPATAGQAQVEDVVSDLAADPSVHGVLIQLPLPEGLDPEPVLGAVGVDKDVDGLTERSLGRLVRGLSGHVPCTTAGIMHILAAYGIETSGRRAVVLGRSTLVGLPTALMLARRGVDATVTLAHSRSQDLASLCAAADILVSAVGVPGLVGPDWVKPGATVLDVGLTRTDAGIRGDVDFEGVSAVASAITPMPGGTGAMTPACLLENTLEAARRQGVEV